MIYIYQDSQDTSKLLIIKADSQEKVNENIHLKDTQLLLGHLTDRALSVFVSFEFAVYEL